MRRHGEQCGFCKKEQKLNKKHTACPTCYYNNKRGK